VDRPIAPPPQPGDRVPKEKKKKVPKKKKKKGPKRNWIGRKSKVSGKQALDYLLSNRFSKC